MILENLRMLAADEHMQDKADHEDASDIRDQ